MILTKEGKIYATGVNSLGQFGNGNKDNKKEFTLIDNISDVYSAVAGNTYSMFIKEDGTIDVGELANQDKEKREIINIIQTNKDGSYEIQLDSGIYDLLFIKPVYLSHRITGIDLTDGTGVTLDNVEMIGGDVAPSDEIEIDDLVELNDNYGVNITKENKEEKSIYDLNGDRKVDILDIAILKKNYGRIAEGTVTYAGVQNGYGKCIEIKHNINGKTIYSFYAHLSKIDVKVGEKVGTGDVIGLEGGAKDDNNPGTSAGHHLHFEIRTASSSGHSMSRQNT